MFAFLRETSFFAPSSFRSAPTLRLRLFDLVWMIILCAILLLIVSAPARAQSANTIFLTDRNGQIPFPILPPNRATGGPGSINNMAIGGTTPAPGTFSLLRSGGGLPTIASGACGTGTNGAVVGGSTDQS